ncbi:hypothetical protein [Cylindrospermum sp. FACHB-282]|uniref:hypothetical protein n=1 Tax=Cylindrospermum sp. FACHB-282 TaxID=2692794 RepID=UPI001683997F|nr:hypothetical protein [Cylindrospermum sp. FACHB-282]MBD2388826.1 hypothetical protein [Cylindrospermum sp. FACHB-282]
MFIILLVLAVFYFLALVVICVMVLSTGAVTGCVIGSAVGATSGGQLRPCERRLKVYHSGCLGSVIGFIVAGVFLGVAAVVLFQ